MKILEICRSKLLSILSLNLAEYKLLECLYFLFNWINYLPKHLFDGFKNLKKISFKGNKLGIIEPTIFDGLNNLIYVDLKNNPNYSIYYCAQSTNEEISNFIKFKDNLTQLFLKNIKLHHSFNKVQLNAENCLYYDIKRILQDNSLKDFKILIGDREFPVHKFVIAARSPKFAEILKKNPEVENLSLHDIPVDTFEIILNYMYTAKLPKVNEYDQLSLFAASGRLKIDFLKDYTATHIFDQTSNENAFKVLKLSNKYEHYVLKQKSFDVIKKKYPKIAFKDEWIETPETVRIIIEKFEKKEEAMRKMEEDFENQRASM